MTAKAKLKAEAWAALRLARGDMPDLEPDRRDVRGGESFGWVSAQHLSDEAARVMRGVGLEVQYKGAKHVQGPPSVLVTSWTWVWIDTDRSSVAMWESDTVEVVVELDKSLSNATTASIGAVTTARKIFLRQLLEVTITRSDIDERAEAMDRGRRVVADEVRAALTKYCQRSRVSEADVLAWVVPMKKAEMGAVDLTFGCLTALEVARLWVVLLGFSAGASVEFDAGASPVGMEPMPEWEKEG